MVMEVKLLQLKNVNVPMVVKEDGRMTGFRLLHNWNAEVPMVVKEEGKVTVLRLLQLKYLLVVDVQ